MSLRLAINAICTLGSVNSQPKAGPYIQLVMDCLAGHNQRAVSQVIRQSEGAV